MNDNKIFNRRIYIVILVIALCVLSAYLFRSYFMTREIRAKVSPLEIEMGKSIIYSDSTRGASEWLWEFGDGKTSTTQNGEYFFDKKGKFQVRLTVDNSIEKLFIVNIRSSTGGDKLADLVKIDAPLEAMQGEYITFRGVGFSKEWRWQFGESKMVDSREKNTIYSYKNPGNFEVLLTTEETKYPIRHNITILPKYIENVDVDLAGETGNDIKIRLQAIVDQKSFNVNYNYILKKYLCNDSNALVIVNNDKKNNFYSYCQGLRLIGKNRTSIESVSIDVDPENEKCIKKLIVIQLDK